MRWTPSISGDRSAFPVRFRGLLHRRQYLRKIHLAWLVYHKKVGDRTVMHAKEVLMQGKHSSNMIADPILTTADFPKKICSSG